MGPALRAVVGIHAGGMTMPLYIDIHKVGQKVDAKAVAEAHKKDLEVQGKYGVQYLNYWVDEAQGDIYCLSQAPSAEAAIATHREAHGMVPTEIHEVVAG
jgi:hypothetical protein